MYQIAESCRAGEKMSHWKFSPKVFDKIISLYKNDCQYIYLLRMGHQLANFGGEGSWPENIWKDVKL